MLRAWGLELLHGWEEVRWDGWWGTGLAWQKEVRMPGNRNRQNYNYRMSAVAPET